MTPVDALWSRVQVAGPDECWFWTGLLGNHGYGLVYVGGKHVLAHRLAYESRVEKIQPGKVLRHLCEGRYAPTDHTYKKCCNPAHLRPGTRKENAADMYANGREPHPVRPVGAQHHMTKLTVEQVLAARERFAAGLTTNAELSREYNVNSGTMHDLLMRKTWRHV